LLWFVPLDGHDPCFLQVDSLSFHLVQISPVRSVLCCATGKPYDYHNEAGEYMNAGHRTPIICRFRDCLNPDHLYWETRNDGCKRREAEERARTATGVLVSALTTPEALLSIA